MGLLDNDTVIVDAILTKLGRQKLANGEPLNITQYDFGDTGVDYTLYNPNHPSGSSSYGTAITSLPMLEAVPDDNVFLRYRLYGSGERNIQNFSFITVITGTSVTITKIAGETESNPVSIVPRVFPRVDDALYDFKILDLRGLSVEGVNPNQIEYGSGGYGSDTTRGLQQAVGASAPTVDLPPFDHPDPVIATIANQPSITLNAQPQQITTQRSIGVEISRDGAASGFVTVTINTNNTTA
jgi:hypothetical protein